MEWRRGGGGGGGWRVSLSAMSSDRLGLGSQVRELKIGQSFNTDPDNVGTAFHTIRYDFKPASVDQHSRESKLTVGKDGKSVAVEVPNVDGNQVTNYR